MADDEERIGTTPLMKRNLTVKQRKFAAYLVGLAQGNQKLAARMAGYRGDDRQLAVQGSVNMRDPRIRKLINEMLESMVEPSLNALGEGLKATKQRAFMTKAGEILYGQAEPDHRVRVTTAARILDQYERWAGNSTTLVSASTSPSSTGT